VLGARSSGQRQREPQREHRSWLAALLVSAAAHGSLLLWASGHHRPVAAAPAPVSVSVSFLPAREPDPPLPADSKSSARTRPVRQPALRRFVGPARARAEASPPAAAATATIVAPAADPGAPLDLTGDTLVTGTAHGQGGGVTASRGTGSGAGRTPGGTDRRSTPGARWPGSDVSRAISLEEQSWSCPWPREGDAAQIDEQTVIIRVVVRADGSTESVEVLADPGHGFGQAAVACALRTRFTPARNPQGEPVRARSPPIKVRFTR